MHSTNRAVRDSKSFKFVGLQSVDTPASSNISTSNTNHSRVLMGDFTQCHLTAAQTSSPPVSISRSTGTGREHEHVYNPSIQTATKAHDWDPPNAEEILCWDHGCEGKKFTNYSNYRRHCREQSDQILREVCENCGRDFSRIAAKIRHQNEGRCKQIKSWHVVNGSHRVSNANSGKAESSIEAPLSGAGAAFPYSGVHLDHLLAEIFPECELPSSDLSTATNIPDAS